MSKLERAEFTEQIVGVGRHSSEHIGRAVSDEARVYVLHSQECIDRGVDLRSCPFSVALDVGLDGGVWEHFEDMPVLLAISAEYGDLEPVRAVAA